MLAKTVSDRPQSAKEVVEVLTLIRAGLKAGGSEFKAIPLSPEPAADDWGTITAATPRPTATPPRQPATVRPSRGLWIAAGVAVLLAGVALAVVSRVIKVETPREMLSGRETATASNSQTVPRSVNLMGLINLKQHALRGDWRSYRDGLISPDSPRALLRIPYEPPEEYRFEVEVERIGPPEGLVLCMGGGWQVSLDTYGAKNSGLGLLDGKYPRENVTFVNHMVIKGGAPRTIACTVRSRRVTVTCDGESVIDWIGSLKQLSPPDTDDKMEKDFKKLYIGTFTSYRITKILLTAY
jgi:hypothetical protein